jgi:hypothetical protein
LSETSLPAPAWGYDARTVHIRFTPFVRRFSYSVFQLLLDVDRIGEAAKGLWSFRYNRAGLFSFFDKDHGDRSGAPLRAWAEAVFKKAGIALDGGAIRLLCFPRVLGYVFNPISVFFGYGPDGALRGVIYEVNNTFGETHSYVAHTDGEGPQKHGAEKLLHVSPFFDVVGAYAFTIRAPEAQFSLVIENMVDGARTHLATLKGQRRPLTDGRLLAWFFTMPLMTLKVVAGIHWEALFLWMKGAGYRRKPAPPRAPFSVAQVLGAPNSGAPNLGAQAPRQSPVETDHLSEKRKFG